MWEQLKRIIKPNGAIVLTASQPFTSVLICSNLKMFKYSWVWHKTQAVGHLNAWRQPMRNTEDVVVFYKKQCTYNPIITDKLQQNIRPQTKRTKSTDNYGNHRLDVFKCPPDKSMPATILKFANAQRTVHPTQKPVALMEYMIKTYTNEGETVLDFTAGSFTTGVACVNLNRKFIGIEKDLKYFELGKDRVLKQAGIIELP